MIQNWTLSRYLARHFLLWFLIFLFALTGIILLFELAELFRRTTNIAEATFQTVLLMGIYKLPLTVERILPFVVLFSGMYTFWRLTKSQELVIARASGVSVWQFLKPALLVTFLFSIVNLAVLNPMGASFAEKYRLLESKYLLKSDSLELTGAGLWLRQTDTENNRHYLLHADRVEMAPLTLVPVFVIIYDATDNYLGRIDAPKAVLKDHYWQIDDAWANDLDVMPTHHESMAIKTNLTVEKIQESMAAPNTISVWHLPAFIDTLQSIGFMPLRHELRLQTLLAQPVFLCAMVFLSAAFSLRLNRKGGIMQTMVLGLFTSVVFFSLNNVVNTLGANQTLPIILAAWSIPLAALTVGYTALLYLEDG